MRSHAPHANSGGASSLNHPSRACVDSMGRLFVADTRNNRILIWNTVPTSNNAPADIVVGQADFNSTSPGLMSFPSRIATDGTRLAVADMEHHRILIWNSIPTMTNQAPDIMLWSGGSDPYRFNLPQGVYIYNDHLIVADSGFHRVLIWNSFPTSATAPNDLVLCQPDMSTTLPGKARDRMYIPLNVWFDGDYLWVGEFKFADRVLGFRAAISETSPAAPTGLTASPVSSHQMNLAWTDLSSNERGFILERKTGSSGTWAPLAYLSANTQQFSDIELSSNTPYYYRIKSYNRYGESGYSESHGTTFSSNSAPYTPNTPSPSDGENGVNNTPLLSWQGGDPDAGDAVTYKIYLDTVNPPTYKVASDISDAYCRPSTLSMAKTYYWRIVASDLDGATTVGPVWSFQTFNNSGYSLVINTIGSGATNPRPGNYAYAPNDTVNITAIPDSGSSFLGWSGDVPKGSETKNPLTLSMDSNKSITARFSSPVYQVVGDFGSIELWLRNNSTWELLNGANPELVIAARIE